MTHAHPDHASGAAAIGGAHPQARFRKYPWPDQDASYPVGWRDSGRRRSSDCGRCQRPDGGAHARAFTRSPGVLARAERRPCSPAISSYSGSSVMIHSSGGGDLQQYLQSLERVRALEPRRLLPAHGPEVTDPEALLTGYLRPSPPARAAGDGRAAGGPRYRGVDRRIHLSWARSRR